MPSHLPSNVKFCESDWKIFTWSKTLRSVQFKFQPNSKAELSSGASLRGESKLWWHISGVRTTQEWIPDRHPKPSYDVKYFSPKHAIIQFSEKAALLRSNFGSLHKSRFAYFLSPKHRMHLGHPFPWKRESLCSLVTFTPQKYSFFAYKLHTVFL